MNCWTTVPFRLHLRIFLVLVGGFAVHFSLGTLFACGNLAPYVASYIHNMSLPQTITMGTTTLLYSLAVVSQGLSMVVGGWLDSKIGPRLTTLAGSLLMSSGVMLSYFAIKVSFWFLLFTYGALFGCGLGMAYISPLACAIRWLPRWKGSANGLIISGFGLGAVLFAYMQTLYINPNNLIPEDEEESFFSNPDVLSRIPTSFLIFGSVHLVVQVVGSLLLSNPPMGGGRGMDGNLPRPQTSSAEPTSILESTHQAPPPLPPSPFPTYNVQCVEDTSAQLSLSRDYHSSTDGQSDNLAVGVRGYKMYGTASWTPNIITSVTPRQMVCTLGFWYLWLLLLCAGTSISSVVTLYKYFGQSFIQNDHYLAITGSVAAIFNSMGSIALGVFVDRFNYKVGLVFLVAMMSSLLLTIYTSVVAGKEMYSVWVCGLFFCVGGLLSLFPTATARSFGSKYFAMNYGILFTANGLSAVLSTAISSLLLPHVPWYGLLFVVSGSSLLAFVAVLLYRHKRYMPFSHRPPPAPS